MGFGGLPMPECPICQHKNAPAADSCTACGAALTTIAESRDDNNSTSTAPEATAQSPLEQRIRELLIDGRKIEAVKVYREATGAGLAEAKKAVESIEDNKVLPARMRDGTNLEEFEQQLERLLRDAGLIAAIKHYREGTGRGLKESKEALEALARQRAIPIKKVGCGATVVLLLATVLGAFTAIALF
jgi:ribosomal protein L7/L12